MPKVKKKLNNILGEGDLQAIGDLMGGLLDKQAAVLASKKDLKEEITASGARLKAYMHQGFEAVMNGM